VANVTVLVSRTGVCYKRLYIVDVETGLFLCILLPQS
jgi:hypothetical protein